MHVVHFFEDSLSNDISEQAQSHRMNSALTLHLKTACNYNLPTTMLSLVSMKIVTMGAKERCLKKGRGIIHRAWGIRLRGGERHKLNVDQLAGIGIGGKSATSSSGNGKYWVALGLNSCIRKNRIR